MDATDDRVAYFDADGTFRGQWGTAGSGDGQFTSPTSVAVTADGQTVYVTDSGNQRVQVFDAAGTFLGAWGRKGSNDGEFASSDTGLAPGPWGVAVAPDGTVYVTDASPNDRGPSTSTPKAPISVSGAATATRTGSSTNPPGWQWRPTDGARRRPGEPSRPAL